MNKCFFSDERSTVAIDTGKIRGCFLNGVYYFRGIPYCKAERYMAPQPVEPWEGVRNAFTYGRVSPTIKKPDCEGPMSLAAEPLFGYRYRPEGEDCQTINVWTKDISGKGPKKPVMVWVHGGAFATGSSVEQMSYDPTNLCYGGDVVCVSFNHRLNILGYLDLSDYGEKYWNSGNRGMEDIVEALKWVKRNIEVFGGDPDNVTLFGQSGGGGKIMVLLQMPCANDLYNRVIMQSGVIAPNCSDEKKRADGKIVAAAILKELGLTKETVDDICDRSKFSFDDLRSAYLKIEPAMQAQGVSTWWAPVPNGYYVNSFMDGEFTEKALKTPVLMGCNAAERCLGSPEFIPYSIPEEQKLTLIRGQYGDDTDKLIELFRKAYPEKDLMHLYYMDYSFRTSTYDFLDHRVKAGAASTWNYMLDFDFNFGGCTPSYHGAELPLVFNSTDWVDAFNEPDAQALGVKMSSAWAQFAHTGDPNISMLPQWKPCGEDGVHTMVFGRSCAVRDEFDRELQTALRKFAKPLGVK